MKKLGISLLLILTAHILCGQIIRGKVIDSDSGEGLIGAHIYLLTNWRVGTIAGDDGAYSLAVAEEDKKDSLIVSYVGFKEQVVPVSDGLTIRMEMIESAGETVIVTAKPLIAEEFKYVEIKKLDIYTNPAAKADPLLAVNSLPSSTTTDESANISLRGSSPIETGVFLNNVPIYDAVRYSQLNGIGTFSIFNTSIIQSVTVFPGNPSLEFGNSTSGIISMQTDERILDGNANSLILSLASSGVSRQQRLNDNQSLKVFTNWQTSGPIKTLNGEALEDIESFTSNDLGIYWYGSNENINWKILSYSVTEGYQFNFKHPTYQGIFDQDKKRSFLISSIERPLGSGFLSIKNALSYSFGNYKYSNVDFAVKKRDLFGGLNYQIGIEKLSVKTGISYDYRNAGVNGSFHEFPYALAPTNPIISVDETVNVKTLESYGYFKYFLSDKLTFGTGFRKNLPLDNGRDYLSRQANLSFINDTWTVTMGLGLYHKNGLYENTGAPFEARNSQRSIDAKREKNGLEIALSLFDKEGDIDGLTYSAKGLELYSSYRFSSMLRSSASITLLDAENSDESNFNYDISYFVRGNIAYSPGSMWTIESIFVAREGTNFSPISNAVFDSRLEVYQPVFSSESKRLSAYANIGISVSKIFPVSDEWNIIAFASLNNATDRDNLRGYLHNFDYTEKTPSLFSRRTGYMGVQINF